MSWSIINIVMFLYFQEEQNFNKGVKHTSWRFNWPILSNGILADLPHTVFCLPVEAKYVILEKSSIYCCQILLYNSDCPVVWNNVLGCRQKKVMIINKKKEVENCECRISYSFIEATSSLHLSQTCMQYTEDIILLQG